MRNLKGSLPALFLGTVGALFTIGCGQSVTFNVLAPAKVNVKKLAGEGEPSVSLGEWKSNGEHDMQAQEIKQFLRERIVAAEGGVVKFAEADGAVRLDGALTLHSYKEAVRVEKSTCTKKSGDKTVEYPCTHYHREGKVSVRASMNVLGANGNTITATTESCENELYESATDAQPAQIDPEPSFLNCRQTVASAFAKQVVPFRVNITKPWFKCGKGNDQCKAALEQIRAGNFDTAEDLLAQAKGLAAGDSKALSGVEWGMALIAEFSGRYAKAEEHVKQASQLNPGEEAFTEELAAIRKREADDIEVQEQIKGS